MCQICGAPIDPDAKAPDSLAAVIDHRIPLAKGGTHGPENWQAAHSYCNSVKRDLIPA
jgi:5-methylcytosine-specific restriction endonuclease McrA